MILHHDLCGWDERKLIGLGLVVAVLTVVVVILGATPPELGGEEGHGGAVVVPVDSAR